MNLIENLAYLAADWLSAHHDAGNTKISLSTLGSRVHQDAKLFERLQDGNGRIAVDRFEALIDYLSTPESWPANFIPAGARVRLAKMGIVQPGERLVVERDTVERQAVA